MNCKTMVALKERREALLLGKYTQALEAELSKIHSALMDHKLFWHPHNCED
jgi:hypothetical protein